MITSAGLARLASLAVTDTPYFLVQTRERLRQAARPDYRWKRTGRAGAPVSVSIEVTHKCNLHCYMCDLYGTGVGIDSVRAGADRPEETFTREEDDRMMAQLAALRPTVSLTGGEPFVVPRGMRLVELAARHGLTTTVVTNGTLLERDAADLVASGLNCVTVSIEGPAAVHDDVRGVGGSFERALRGIRKLNEVKASVGTNRPHVEINTTICGRNCGSLSEMVYVAEELGVERLQFSHLWYWHPAQVEMHNRVYRKVAPCTVQNCAGLEGLDVEQLLAQIEVVRRYRGPLPVKFLPDMTAGETETYYCEPLSVVKQSRCIAPWLTVRIMPNGDVIPCLDVAVGNLRESTFAQLWNNDKYREFRPLVRDNRLLPGCLHCCKLFCY